MTQTHICTHSYMPSEHRYNHNKTGWQTEAVIRLASQLLNGYSTVSTWSKHATDDNIYSWNKHFSHSPAEFKQHWLAYHAFDRAFLTDDKYVLMNSFRE